MIRYDQSLKRLVLVGQGGHTCLKHRKADLKAVLKVITSSAHD